MTAWIGAKIVTLNCDASNCGAYFDYRVSPDSLKAREAAILDGWVSVKPPTGPSVDYCQRHALGSKGPGSSQQLRVFQPPATEGT